MIGIQVDVARMLAIAESLRQQIPSVSPEVARPMIDAAGELQRLADQLQAASKTNAELVQRLVAAAADQCQCPVCTARRAAAEPKPKPGDLN